MKSIFLTFAALLLLAIPTQAADITVKGVGTCAKCDLKKTKDCQNVVKTSDGKIYYLAQNDVSKKFHSHLCKNQVKVEVKGAVKIKGGKLTLTASSIKKQ